MCCVMICWFKYPFIRLLIPFAIGIWLAFCNRSLFVSEKNVLVLLIILMVLLTLLIISSKIIRSFRYRYVFSILLNVFLLIIGFSFVRVHEYRLKINDLSRYDFVPRSYVARLKECPTVKDNSIKVLVEMLEIEDAESNKYKSEAKIIAYFEKNEESLSLDYGDCIVFVTNPEEVDKPPNPEQFDYKDYLYKKGVTHQVYLQTGKWMKLGYNISNPIYKFSYWLRDFLIETMQELGVRDEEFAVASAILLGYDDSLPMDLRQKYVAAGAMHILCVSGLHVGVIFMVFSSLLFFLDDRNSLQRIVKHIVLLLLIWLYALLAGLAPSILRATIMLSFVIVGNIINKKGILLNSLAVSALILLCVNPANLFDVGFLLSYVAVIGIVILQKPISKLVYSRYEIINKVWEITSVTIAAQIATAPFTIYYFHQFPAYFWLSNLFMTPISSVVITGGMIMLLVFFIPYINTIVAFLVSKMIYVMNFGVDFIESLPYSIIKGIYINEAQFVILLMILLFLLLFVELKEKFLLFLMMILTVFFLIINFNKVSVQKKQNEMIFYSINNATVVDFICGREHFLMSDSIFLNDKSSFSYNIENYLVKKGVFSNGKMKGFCDNFDGNFVKKRKSVVIFGEKLLGLSDGSEIFNDTLSYKIPLDYMLVYGRKRQSLTSLLNVYNIDCLIIDKTVPSYLTSELIEEANKFGIKYHSIRENGAFLVK